MGFFSPNTISDFVRRGDLDGVRHRLDLGDDVNERRSFQSTPLIEAARLNYCTIIEVLLKHGAGMELVDSNNFTALHMAIDKKHTNAALLLARRGACANTRGFLGRTPLQSAVKRDLLKVTTELLALGADPTICNNWSTWDYVSKDTNRAKFLQLLDPFTDMETAIRAKNKDAVTVWLRKILTGDPTSTISGIDAAIQLKQAVTEAGIENATDPEWHETLTQVGEEYKKNWLEKVVGQQDMGQLQTFVERVAKLDWMQNVTFKSGWTPLHYAASRTNFELAQYLLVGCGLNPLALNPDKKTARDLAVEAGSSSKLLCMLQQHMKKQTFADHSALLLSTKEVTVDGLQQLLGQITSVYDLGTIFNLGFQALAPGEMHVVLTKAFDEVIREKLVFDNQAAACFKMGLKACKRQKYISEKEKIEWDLKVTQVNVENSDWVREIKNSLQEVECRVATTERNVELLHSLFDKLRNALVQREEHEIKQRERQRYISLLSSALVMCGGGVIKEVFGAAFDLCGPEQLLSALSAENLKGFLAEKTTTLIFEEGVEAILADADVDPAEFAAVLKKAVYLERIETTAVESAVLPSPDPEPENPLFPPKKCHSFKDAVHALLQRKASSGQAPSSTSPALASQMSEADMVTYPYHLAVQASEGDLDHFQEVVQYIEQEGGCINETLTMYARPVESDGMSSKWETIKASALVYASYLGHVEIVKWFLAHADVVKTEKSFLTVTRSRSSSKNINEVCFKRPTCSA